MINIEELLKAPDKVKVKIFDVIVNHLSNARNDKRPREKMRSFIALTQITKLVKGEEEKISITYPS